jgi:hypothetical protein
MESHSIGEPSRQCGAWRSRPAPPLIRQRTIYKAGTAWADLQALPGGRQTERDGHIEFITTAIRENPQGEFFRRRHGTPLGKILAPTAAPLEFCGLMIVARLPLDSTASQFCERNGVRIGRQLVAPFPR